MHEVNVTDSVMFDVGSLRIELSEEQLKLLAEMIAEKIVEINKCSI